MIFLEEIKVENLSDVLLVGILRLTSSKKDELTYWNKLLELCYNELNKRGYDSNIIMKGLI
jgi:hypothetical protein